MSNSERQFLVFKLAGKNYGINIEYINSIIEKEMVITRVPNSLDFVEGVINLRGEVVPIMDLRKRLKLETAEDTIDTRIIVIEKGEVTIGLIVDLVMEVAAFDDAGIDNISAVSDLDDELFQGTGKMEDAVVSLINVEKLISE